MRALELKVPPAVLVIICALLMYFSPNPIMYLGFSLEVTYYLSRALFVLAVFIIVAGIYCFRKANTTVDPTSPDKASTLVSYGIFKYSRNPMYLGFAIVLLGFAIKIQTLIAILWVVVFVLYLTQFQIKPEERALRQIFGDEYSQYCKQVRRWI